MLLTILLIDSQSLLYLIIIKIIQTIINVNIVLLILINISAFKNT